MNRNVCCAVPSADERFAIEHLYFQRGFRLRDHCSLSGRIPWDFYQREDFEEKAKAERVAKKKSSSFRGHCSGNN